MGRPEGGLLPLQSSTKYTQPVVLRDLRVCSGKRCHFEKRTRPWWRKKGGQAVCYDGPRLPWPAHTASSPLHPTKTKASYSLQVVDSLLSPCEDPYSPFFLQVKDLASHLCYVFCYVFMETLSAPIWPKASTSPLSTRRNRQERIARLQRKYCSSTERHRFDGNSRFWKGFTQNYRKHVLLSVSIFWEDTWFNKARYLRKWGN